MKKHIRLLIMTLLMFGLTLALAVVVNAETQEEATVVSTNDVTEYCMATSELKDAGAKKRGDTGIDRTLLIVCDSEFDCTDLEGLTNGVFGPYGLCVLQFDTTENATFLGNKKFLAYPSLTSLTSPFLPVPFTSFNNITFIYSSSFK